MNPTLRKFLFWPHLVAGVVAGLVIALLCLTGAAIAFESAILVWADADSRRVTLPGADAQRLPLELLVQRAQEAYPQAKINAVTVYAADDSAVFVGTGRKQGVYVDPYSGAVRPQGAEGWRSFFHTMEAWHRWLGAEGDARGIGRAVTGAANAVFLFLALSGLLLWWPRKWTRAATRSVTWFRRGLRGKARDFNWHHVIGFWSLPILVVLTASGMVISYRWASDLVFVISGSEPPKQSGPARAPVIAVDPPSPAAAALPLQALFDAAAAHARPWESISLRQGLPSPATSSDAKAGGAAPAQAVTFSVRELERWPRFAQTDLSINPFSGAVVREHGFADADAGRRARSWLRFLHTGEAFGWFGQLVATVASLGGAVLVWTGLALSLRRFTAWRRARRGHAPPVNGDPLPEHSPAQT